MGGQICPARQEGFAKLTTNQEQAPAPEKLAWTDERVELLKRLWSEGLSASQIAGRLAHGVTRNAVIGKVHRLGLSGRVTPSAQPTRAPVKPASPRIRAVPR